MEIDRKTNLILKNSEIYRAFPMFQKMVDNTIFLSPEAKHASDRYVDEYYGTELVRESVRGA